MLALISSCDSRAKASDPAGGREQKSKEYETCSSSAACADELRCFEHTCKRATRSTVEPDWDRAQIALAPMVSATWREADDPVHRPCRIVER